LPPSAFLPLARSAGPMSPSPLVGIRGVCVAVYVPALVAAQRLRALGATMTIVEPPAGDPMAVMCRPWYDAMHAGQSTVSLDLKTPGGRANLAVLLAQSDLLVTALRPAALERLGLGWSALHSQYPSLCHIAIVGYPAPRAEEPGHDLTYQARAGVLEPPLMPRSLIADLAGAERAAQAALAALVGRERGQGSTRFDVSLADAVESFADPFRFGVTAPGSILGGGFAGYGIYAAQDGWIALAALEPHFWTGLLAALGVAEPCTDREILNRVFASRTAAEWERWAIERDLPIVAVRSRPDAAPRS
jgi:alpha-methylacyl-CoA racemase